MPTRLYADSLELTPTRARKRTLKNILCVVCPSERSGEALASVPLRRRGLNRRSYTEGDAVFLGDSPEGAVPQPRVSPRRGGPGPRMAIKKVHAAQPHTVSPHGGVV